MADIDIRALHDRIAGFAFERLFIEELGWNRPTDIREFSVEVEDRFYELKPIAELGSIPVFEVSSPDGGIPLGKETEKIDAKVAESFNEHLLIFIDAERTRSLWYWTKLEGTRRIPRRHEYLAGQPTDLFVHKIVPLAHDFHAFEGDPTVLAVSESLRKGLDIEQVTRRFYTEFQKLHEQVVKAITGITNDHDCRWYATVLLNRLMFVWFLQAKLFLDKGDRDYLPNRLERSKTEHPGTFYSRFLGTLFFRAFACPREKRGEEVTAVVGEIPYLNGGLFLHHRIETDHPDIDLSDEIFDEIFRLFGRFSWHLDDRPGGKADEINPDVLGYIFEKYINQKEFGAYYTPRQITSYLCDQTVEQLLLERVNELRGETQGRVESLGELLLHIDPYTCRKLYFEILPELSLLDPSCGSGAFLIAAMQTLEAVYHALIGRIPFLKDTKLTLEKENIEREHHSLNYWVRKKIITRNLFGVDIMEEAVEIARLRLFLALVASVERADQLEPLPNIDFNILDGNSLVGLLRVDEAEVSEFHRGGDMFTAGYRDLVREKEQMIGLYRDMAGRTPPDGGEKEESGLEELRNRIEEHRETAQKSLNEMLAKEFAQANIKFEEVTWDEKKGKPGRPNKRGVLIPDIELIRPFHWGFEFSTIMNERGGFDAVITNPPWETFKPQAKEFFAEYSDVVTKNKMTIKEFEREQKELLQDKQLRNAWLDYLSRFPHMSKWYRTSNHFKHQVSMVNGRKQSSDLNLYKLFLERCFDLLAPGGRCGIVIPSGIYTDLGAKGLREMLFKETEVTGLFGFENRKAIFEGVHRSFKFVVLSFIRGGTTEKFPATFMHLDPDDLKKFPKEIGMMVDVETIRRLSPDSLSLMEFREPIDLQIAEKALAFPLLGEQLEGTWNLKLANEFHMTNDSRLFHTEPGPGRLPLYEGKMIHQYQHLFESPRYWINEKEGRKATLGARADNRELLDYQMYRLALRRIGRDTDTRTLISTILPPGYFASESFHYIVPGKLNLQESCYLAGVFNSFIVDYLLRHKVAANISMFYIYQLPLPRLTADHPEFAGIVERAARLICVSPEYDALAAEVGLRDHRSGAGDPEERKRLRAELDGIVGRLYGLTEEEFAHVLGTFPLVDRETKNRAMEEFRNYVPAAERNPTEGLIAAGEGERLEFKETLEADGTSGEKHPGVLASALKTICAFLNADGGTLLIGVCDDGKVAGLDPDFRLLGKKGNPDGLELKLRSLLGSRFHPVPLGQVRIGFPEVRGRLICRIDVEGSREVAHFDQDVYVRDGNRTLKLTGPGLTAWIADRMRGDGRGGKTGNRTDGAGTGSTAETVAAEGSDDPDPEATADPVAHPTSLQENVEEVLQNDPPEREEEEKGRPRPIDDYGPDELVCIIRNRFSDRVERERDEAMREIAAELGYARLGPRLRKVLNGAMLAAVKRYVISRGDDGLYGLETTDIGKYTAEELKENILAAAGRAWIERDDLVVAAARRLGFSRTGKNIRRRLRGLITRLITEGELEKDGSEVRRN